MAIMRREAVMAALTIRKLDDELKQALRLRAARNGRSMEEEARQILAARLRPAPAAANLAQAIREIVDPVGGIELDIPPRSPGREPPDFTSPDFGPPDDESGR
jgi:plasmid stability protein